jgi:hypothetical protein
VIAHQHHSTNTPVLCFGEPSTILLCQRIHPSALSIHQDTRLTIYLSCLPPALLVSGALTSRVAALRDCYRSFLHIIVSRAR